MKEAMRRHLKNYFIPHPGNDHKPHSLRHKTILAFFLFVIILEFGFLVQVFIVFDKTKFLASVLPAVLTALTNEDRANIDAPPLKENELLKRAAEEKAKDMAEKGYFAHTSPEGRTPWYWLDQVGYKYTYAGENLAVNFFDSDDVEKAWMNSPTHRANIVRKDYTEIGIGIARGKYEGRNTIFVAQFFGTPTSVAFAEATPVQNINTETQAPKTVASSPTKPTTPKPTTPKTTPTAVVTTPVVPTVAPVATNITPTEIQVLGEETIGTPPGTSGEIVKQSRFKVFFEKILTSPRDSVNNIYLTISLFMLFAIAMVIFVRSEIKHPLMIFRGFALVLVIAVLSFVNLQVFDIKTEIPNDITANVIQVFP